MKTKIITSSSSSINFIGVPHVVDVIPDLICYSKNEEYLDYQEALPEVFYNRFKLNSSNLPIIKPNTIEYIKKLVKNAIELEYEHILFVLPLQSIIDYKANIDLAMLDLKISYTIYQTNLIAYPLANLVIEAARLLNEDVNVKDVIKYLDNLCANSGVYLYSPKEDLLPTISRLEFDDDVLIYDKDGKIFTITMTSLVEIKHDKKVYPLQRLLNLYHNSVKDSSVMPFILYSSKLSYYIYFLEKTLLQLYPRMKKIKAIPIPPALGIKIGCNAIGLGYIKKSD